MSKGYVIVAMQEDYVKQACLLAKSIKQTQTINNISIVTSDKVPDEHKNLFDKIIEIPWHEDSNSFYITEHRWKVFHLTPYEETVVLDTDMLFLTDISHWWKYFAKNDVGFITNVLDYRSNLITSDFYRKTFTANDLPNIYVAFHYFKKSQKALDYYKLLNMICDNWEKFYKKYVPKLTPEMSSMDVNHAIALKISQIENYQSTASINFTHMKSKVQGWENNSDNWTDIVPYYFTDDKELKIGNYLQTGLFHYTENSFAKTVGEVYGTH
tara:strand:+ start:1679 stop:2485 length:807 start_codon:yes stop_codon:yes gene_type:complete